MIHNLKKLIDLLWTIWCLISGSILILLNLPILLSFIVIFRTKKNNALDYYIRITSACVLFFFFLRMTFIKTGEIDNKKNYVFISNHRSYLDVFIAIISIKQYKKFLGKEEVFKWPIIGLLARKLGHVSVKRESLEDRQKSYLNLLDILRKGSSIFLCPEGAVEMNDQLINEMRNGAFRMAIESNTPIVAITIVNAGELFPPDKIRIRPGKCINYISVPFETKNLSLNDVDTLREKVKKEILDNLIRHYPKGKYPIEFDPEKYNKTFYSTAQKAK